MLEALRRFIGIRKLVAPERDNALCERMATVARDGRPIAFCVNREGYCAIKPEVDGFAETVFGVELFVCDHQKQRAIAIYDARSLRIHVDRFS